MKKNKLIIASGNKGKIVELRELLSHLPYELIPQSDFAIEDIEETGLTFVENAILKARHAAQQSGCMALSDDSGLSIDALNGAPGIYSARYAGKNATDVDRYNKALEALKDVPDAERNATFHCVLCLFRFPEDPAPLVCHGRWPGQILHAPQGNQGFGYDPIFFDPEHHCSAAEFDPETKNQVSHRGRAIKKLLDILNN